MKRALKILSLLIVAFISVSMGSTYAQVVNYVPEHYYANYKFASDWDSILSRFKEVRAKYTVKEDIPLSKFEELSNHFQKVFPHLTTDYATVYERCSILARNLSKEYSYTDMQGLMGHLCYESLVTAIDKINSSYTVVANATSNPTAGMAPLTVTFDARGSIDPSSETLPSDNFFWFYRDENGVDRPIGYGQTLTHKFEEPGRFIVHLVVRSSNVDKGILDGEKNLTINVTPKAADIVVYANTRKMSSNTPLRLGIGEGKKGIVFDGSLTRPRGGREILSHQWTITNSSVGYSFDSKVIKGAPTTPINVTDIDKSGLYTVTLSTTDNENNTVYQSFGLYMSDPVTIIKQYPTIGTTSTTFNFDGSASYSITNRLNTYMWEVFDGNGGVENGNKIYMAQGKKLTINMSELAKKPGNYLVRLTVTDQKGESNTDTQTLYVESTRPTPQFTVQATTKRTYPSEFTLDASNTQDIDVVNGQDSLEYKWDFYPADAAKIISTENNNEKVVVQFNKIGKHIITLTVTDEYGKINSISRTIEVKSILRPEIEITPAAITWGKEMRFKGTLQSSSSNILDYSWNFGDGKPSINSQFLTTTTHAYAHRGVYNVTLTVNDESGDFNTVKQKVFIGETEQPIAAYRVTDYRGAYINDSETCKIEKNGGDYDIEPAYPINRYAQFTINPSISVNTKGTSDGLQYVFSKEAISGPDKSQATSQLTEKFSQMGCHYVDLVVKDSNIGKQDKTRIRFSVKNALPTVRNLTLTYPQYTENTSNSIFMTDNNGDRSTFDCSGTTNLTIKATAVNPTDSDGNVSRLRFYYYNVDDPDRILEYKEAWLSTPYVYFVIPRMAGEYKFGVMVYDNDGGMVDSKEELSSNPSVYFPASCNDADIPTVTLRVSSNNVQIGDTVTYTIISKIASDNEDFQTDRTFYYDFEGDGKWDLVTKKDTATYTFEEAYEDGVTPKAAVEYRGKLGQAEGATILVKNGIKPILLSNAIKNTVIFRDLSVGVMQRREICFEDSECEAGNSKFKKTKLVTTDPELLTGGSKTAITENDVFTWTYDEYGTHKVSLYFKNKYGTDATKVFDVVTSNNGSNGRIASGINMITLPETTFTNANPEVFLSKDMDNTLLMYINNDGGDTCYVDTDISNDSDGNGKADDDQDIYCNKMAKVLYEPSYESAIGRIYFMNNGQLTFKNFYVTFEGIISELDDEKKELYDEISSLVNGIEDLSVENTDLKSSLDRLRKNLNNYKETTEIVVTIKNQISDGGITLTSKQNDVLNDIIARLENKDTVITVGMNEYEKNKQEIMSLLSESGISQKTKSNAQEGFNEFEEILAAGLEPEEKERMLNEIRDDILSDLKKDKQQDLYGENFKIYFCNMFDYYSIISSKCGSQENNLITENYEKTQKQDIPSKSGGLPLWLKIILIILVGGLLTMGGIIVFFSVKARMNSMSENDEEE